jgi:hypothetical protein
VYRFAPSGANPCTEEEEEAVRAMASGIPAVQVVAAGEAAPVEYAPSTGVDAHLLSAAEFPLWLIDAEVPDGATLRWGTDHGEEVVYVEGGELAAGPRACPEAGAVVIEAGCPAELIARGPTRLLHFGSRAAAPDRPGDPSLQVIGPRGTWAMVEDGRDSHFYADSTSPTCAATLLYTSRNSQWDSSLHSHSADEIIHVMWGDMQFGRWHLGPGGTVAVRADAPYQFRSEAGVGFLNFRAGPSVMHVRATDKIILEGGEVNGFDPVMDLR